MLKTNIFKFKKSCTCLQRVSLDMFDKKEGYDDESFISLYETKLCSFYKDSLLLRKKSKLFDLKKELEEPEAQDENFEKRIKKNQKLIASNSK